ncbi:MAG: hypothetical protein ACTHLA_17545 [Asticcacaulis sp.]|uniref:hypothetical protein n=1 Tax=Asticcacaulis sp. TaxID=1872648 RepID=UPI003F7B4DC8
MSLRPHSIASDLHHQQQEILDYVHEIVQELSEMSARAGLDRLSCDLRSAVLSARVETPDSPERRISSLHG